MSKKLHQVKKDVNLLFEKMQKRASSGEYPDGTASMIEELLKATKGLLRSED